MHANRAPLALTLALLAACTSAPTSEDVDAASDPSCYYECTGGTFCEAGTLYEMRDAPLPCSEWAGECPRSVVGTCREGCFPGREVLRDSTIDPRALCGEARAARPTDECTLSECFPSVYLACDGTHCAHLSTGQVNDLETPCNDEVSRFDGTGEAGFVVDETCGGLACLFADTEETGVAGRCSMFCERELDCPPAFHCEALTNFDDGDDDPNDGAITMSVCRRAL